jgi:hypothetical protein
MRVGEETINGIYDYDHVIFNEHIFNLEKITKDIFA